MPATDLDIVHVYYVHSPICQYLAKRHAEQQTGRTLFISARCTYSPTGALHVPDDQLASRDALLAFATEAGHLLSTLSASGHTRLYLPHVGSAIFRLLTASQLTDSVCLLEEGAYYYAEEPEQLAFGPFNYCERCQLTQEDIQYIGKVLHIAPEDVTRALTGEFLLFTNQSGKMAGAVVSHPVALCGLSWRESLCVQVVPLEKEPPAAGHQDAVMVFLPSHNNRGQTTVETPLVRELTFSLRALRNRYPHLLVSIHPSDVPHKEAIKNLYRMIPDLSFVEELGFAEYTDGNGHTEELSRFEFKGYLTYGASAGMYASRLHGQSRLLDNHMLSWVLDDVLAEHQHELTVLRTQRDEVIRNNADLAALVERQQAESEASTILLERKQGDIARLLNSRSWRLTAPLRHMGRWARRVAHMFQ